MKKTEGTEENCAESCRQCKHWKDAKERVRLQELVESAVEKMQKALLDEKFKPTVGDYAKLVQMEKEIDEAEEDTKEIRVTWVEPTDSKNGE
jgi:uncharacterized protein YhaN